MGARYPLGGAPELGADLFEALRRSYAAAGSEAPTRRTAISTDQATIARALSYAMGLARDQGLIDQAFDPQSLFAELGG